ncbi:hypothetical protein ACOSZF_23390 [Cytobacillus firmus]|uniref:hypothetical protein n=1 Tax=Cytobacillus firmus TaxID=1399 RepID=UPI003BA14906
MLKEQFVKEVSKHDDLKIISVAVKLPSGAIEVITNTQDLENKARYYAETYDDNFCLKHNSSIQIVGYMVV